MYDPALPLRLVTKTNPATARSAFIAIAKEYALIPRETFLANYCGRQYVKHWGPLVCILHHEEARAAYEAEREAFIANAETPLTIHQRPLTLLQLYELLPEDVINWFESFMGYPLPVPAE